MASGWTVLVGQLCDHLQHSEQQLSLLREIDQNILNDSVDLIDVIEHAVKRLDLLLSLQRVSLYATSGDELELLATSRADRPPKTLFSGVLQRAFEQSVLHIQSGIGPLGELAKNLGAEEVLVLPISTEGTQLFGALLLESSNPAAVSKLGDSSIIEYSRGVAQQLAVAIRLKTEKRAARIRREIYSELFENDIRPQSGFDLIARRLGEFLPTTPPFVVEPPPRVDVGIHQAGRNYLAIVASSESDVQGRRLLLANAACGRLFDEDQQTILIEDTLKEKRYLGTPGMPMRSEMAVKLELRQGVSAVLNLEALQPRSFRGIHLSALQATAQDLAPLLRGLYARRQRNQLQLRSIMYGFSNFLHTFSKTLTHNVKPIIAAARGAAQDLGAQLPADGGLRNYAEEIRLSLEGVEERVKNISRDLVYFSVNSRRNIRDLLEAAKSLNSPRELKERDDIGFEVDCPDDLYVFASLFLREIFYNVLHNSVYWIKARQREEPDHEGRIEISVWRDHSRPLGHVEAALNGRIRIRIRDNGMGVASEDLDRLFEEHFTKRKGGSGFGLFAAREYLTLIGGEIRPDSVKGKFFEVDMVVPEYDPSRHAEKEDEAAPLGMLD